MYCFLLFSNGTNLHDNINNITEYIYDTFLKHHQLICEKKKEKVGSISLHEKSLTEK